MPALIGANFQQIRGYDTVKPRPIAEGVAVVDFAGQGCHQGDRIGQGRKNACDFLAANPEICVVVEGEVRRGLLPAHCQSDESAAESTEASAGDDAY